MLKTNLLSIVIISGLLSACGFHVPKNNTAVNASITGDVNSAFASEFKKHLDVNSAPSLRVNIGAEVQNTRSTAYKNNGDTSSYMLTLSVPIKVIRGQELLLSKNLKATTTLKEMELSQANTLQTTHGFAQLRKTVASKLLRILTQLNAN